MSGDKPVTHKEARQILIRFNTSHWSRCDACVARSRGRNGSECARYTIPADHNRDDDVLLGDYIDQNEARDSEFYCWRRPSDALPETSQLVEFFANKHEWCCFGFAYADGVWIDQSDCDMSGDPERYTTDRVYCWRPAPRKPEL